MKACENSGLLKPWRAVHLPNNSKCSIADRPVRLYVQLLLEVVAMLLWMLLLGMVMSLDSSSSLNLGRSSSSCRSRGLSRSRRGEVGLLLARVQHDSSSSCGGVLLDGVHSSSRAWVLQVMLASVVVVMMMHVGRRQVLELMVVMRVMGSHCWGTTVVSSHHFGNICSSCATKSHPTLLRCLSSVLASKYQAAKLELEKLRGTHTEKWCRLLIITQKLLPICMEKKYSVGPPRHSVNKDLTYFLNIHFLAFTPFCCCDLMTRGKTEIMSWAYSDDHSSLNLCSSPCVTTAMINLK